MKLPVRKIRNQLFDLKNTDNEPLEHIIKDSEVLKSCKSRTGLTFLGKNMLRQRSFMVYLTQVTVDYYNKKVLFLILNFVSVA